MLGSIQVLNQNIQYVKAKLRSLSIPITLILLDRFNIVCFDSRFELNLLLEMQYKL